MPIRFFNRLAFKLTRTSIQLVLVLGIIVSFLQLAFDFREELKHLNQNLEQIFLTSNNAAQRAVFTLDRELTMEVIRGLRNYKFLQYIAIFDERNFLMGEYEQAVQPSNTAWLTRILLDELQEHEFLLVSSEVSDAGRLVLRVNTDVALSNFYGRAFYVFVSGFLRNVSLAFMLIFFYHAVLTRPLTQIAKNMSQIDPRKPGEKVIKHIPGHQEDELGHIIDSANQLIASLKTQKIDLIESETQLRLILDTSPNQVFAVNQSGDFVFLNRSTAEFYNSTPVSLVGKNYYKLHWEHNPVEADEIFSDLLEAETTDKSVVDIERQLTNHIGEACFMHTSYIPFQLYEQSCVLVIASDITGRVDAEAKIEKLAYYDVLTNLPNRNRLKDQLEQDIRLSKRRNTFGALLFIDLDDFKKINDTMGHSIGDRLLLDVSIKMQAQIRKSETLARLGGDEFILSVPNISGDIDVTRSHAAELANRIINTIREPVKIASSEFLMSASIGIAIYPNESDSADELLRFADTAMYKAKHKGRDCYEIFNPEMAQEAESLLRLESEIHKAVQKREFMFFLQPVVEAKSGKLICAEALLRWNHKQKGVIDAREFIPFLENSMIITTLGPEILDRVCEFIKIKRSAGVLPPDIRIAVNISSKELYQPDFVGVVKDILQRHQLSGNSLEFEVTEGVALERLDYAIERMQQLRNMGINFSLDDFGTGYSSLSYLKKLPVDKIKIDKSFIDDFRVDEQNAAILASIISIARNLSMDLVVEGVENKSQASFFERYDNILFQGHLTGRPVSPEEFTKQYLEAKH